MAEFTRSKTLIAITADAGSNPAYPIYSAPEAYLNAIADSFGGIPLILPAMGKAIDLDEVLARVDGVLLTGAASNVHPSCYGAAPALISEPYDRARDATNLPLIRAAIEQGIPLFAICRGMQELNVALGGTLHPEIHALPGRIDHRAPETEDEAGRFALRHRVTLERRGYLASLLGESQIDVNSLHRQGVARLADRLAVEARAPDGTIEAVWVIGAKNFALGVQWHPEYWVASDPPSRKLFAAFGEAARRRRMTQGQLT